MPSTWHAGNLGLSLPTFLRASSCKIIIHPNDLKRLLTCDLLFWAEVTSSYARSPALGQELLRQMPSTVRCALRRSQKASSRPQAPYNPCEVLGSQSNAGLKIKAVQCEKAAKSQRQSESNSPSPRSKRKPQCHNCHNCEKKNGAEGTMPGTPKPAQTSKQTAQAHTDSSLSCSRCAPFTLQNTRIRWSDSPQ